MGEVLYEERLYPAGNWACVTKGETLYEQSISMAFMKLMRYICKNSSGEAPPTAQRPLLHVLMASHDIAERTTSDWLFTGRYLGMTVPVLSTVQVDDSGTFEKDVETAFFLPTEFQSNPPCSADPDISVVYREPIRVVAR